MERKVIELCYGIPSGQAMKPEDISKQIGMSTESVRVIKKNAMGKLRCAAAIIKHSLFQR